MADERLVRIPPGRERDALLPLFALADDSEPQVRSYYQHGTLFALSGADCAVRGIVLALAAGHDSVEIKSIAVVPGLQRRGLGSRMLRLVFDELRAGGTRRVTVGTGNSSLGELAFYQRAGLRLFRIERDYFTEARGYRKGIEENGIALRDLVWLDLDLQSAS
jgi:ribosomal protein S18 acetylase RimI-like enzyme